MPWMLTVYQWDQARYERHLHPQGNGGYGAFDEVVVFARDSDYYYVFDQPAAGRFEMAEAESYTAAYQAIRAYAMQTVLETEGVEPFSQNQAPDTDALQARLLNLPEELRDNVEAYADNGALAVYYFKKPGETLNKDQYLLIVSELTEWEFRQNYLSAGYAPVSNGQLCFAQGGGRYYRLGWNTSIEYDMEDQELFNSAFRAVQDYAQKTVLDTEGIEPFDLDAVQEPLHPIWMAANYIYTAPSAQLRLSIGAQDNPGHYTNYPTYTTTLEQDPHSYGYYLNALTIHFNVEPFDWGSTEDPRFPTTPRVNGYLSIDSPDYGAYIRVWEDSDLVAVHDDKNGTSWYHAQSVHPDEYDYATTPYEYLRDWYDMLDLHTQRSATTVQDRGQSHEDIAREWTGNWEGAKTKTVPDSAYACTYVRIEVLKADYHDFMSKDDMNEFARYRELNGADYGKTWFTFCYDTVFVPVNRSKDNNPLWAGNTRYYEGSDAPEGALIYSRVGYMLLTEEGWTCNGVGTGW